LSPKKLSNTKPKRIVVVKKNLFVILILSMFGRYLAAQDTVYVHRKSGIVDLFFKDGIDSMYFETAGEDTLKVKYKGIPSWALFDTTKQVRVDIFKYTIKYAIAQIDSITFKKADTLDYTSVHGYSVLADAAYMFSRAWYGKEDGMGMSEMGTDIWTAGSESIIATSGLTFSNTPFVTYSGINNYNENNLRLWKQMYSGVNLCNLGIKIAQKENFASPDPRFGRLAELYFLRAFYYWHIVETWGATHLTTEPYYTPNIKPKMWPRADLPHAINKASVQEIYQQIVSDLEKAELYANDVMDYGKVKKWAVTAFKARVLLTKGDYSTAKSTAENVIANSGHTLANKYADLWKMENQINSEVIWSVKYDFPEVFTDVYNNLNNPYGYGTDILGANGNPTFSRGNNNLHMLFVCAYDRVFAEFGSQSILGRSVLHGWPFVRFKPTKHLLNLFDEKSDSRYHGSFQTVWIMNKTINKPGHLLRGKTPFRDTACAITKNPVPSTNYYIYDVMATYNTEGGSKNITQNQLFPVLLKYLDYTRIGSLVAGTAPLPDGVVSSQATQSSKDVNVLRIAEMYLIAAEANVRLGNLTAAADMVNILRTKRAIPGKEADMMVQEGDLTLDFILEERAREFAGEQIRWFDVKRIKNNPTDWASWIAAKNPDLKSYIQPYHFVRPIPQVQLDLTPSLGQNTGY
jgi:starch-binding outer membrane protein, SusD/RagB family